MPNALDETNSTVVNILRFLQTIDDDGDTSNGILITQTMRDLAVGVTINFKLSLDDFANNGDVQTLVSELTAVSTIGARSLISADDALEHFELTLADIASGEYEQGGGSQSDSEFNFTISGDDTDTVGTEFSLPDITYIRVETNGYRSLSLIASRYTDNPSQFYNDGVSFAAGISDISTSENLVFTSAIQINVGGDSYQYVSEVPCLRPCNAPPFIINESARTITLNNFILEADDAENTAQTADIVMTGVLNWSQSDEG